MWDVNFIQFTRLLNEVDAMGLSNDQLEALAMRMDVKPEEVKELFNRASSKWDELQPLLLKQIPLTEEQASEELAESGKVQAVVSVGFGEIMSLVNEVQLDEIIEDFSTKAANVELKNIDYKVLFSEDDVLYLKVSGEADDCED